MVRSRYLSDSVPGAGRNRLDSGRWRGVLFSTVGGKVVDGIFVGVMVWDGLAEGWDGMRGNGVGWGGFSIVVVG